MSDSASVTAAGLVVFRLCTGQCLLGLEDVCQCRCRGRWHAALADAEIPVPASLTLAEALAGGPARQPGRRSPARVQEPNTAATPEAAELRYTRELAAGQLPAVRRIKREMRVGQARAYALQRHLERIIRNS